MPAILSLISWSALAGLVVVVLLIASTVVGLLPDVTIAMASCFPVACDRAIGAGQFCIG
jgi:hypothetical protein